jgi:5'-deoxynucleotidase YfbR-like HD superfamily hydrolase
VLRIYSQIWKTLPTDTAIYIIWHDAGEWVSGDPPFPSKANNPDLKSACDRIERKAVIEMGGVLVDLPEEERKRVKATDLIQMIEFAAIEFLMGNRFALPVINDPKEVLQALLETMPSLDRTAIKTYVNKQAALFGLNELCM